MSNELIWGAFLLFDFVAAMFAIYLFGRIGLYAIIILSIITCNIQVLKLVNLFGLPVTFGNIAYGSIFLATDLLGEVYGKKEAQKAVWLGFYALLVTAVSYQVMLALTPNSFDQHSAALESIFQLSPQIMLASLTAYIVSQSHDVWAFCFWKKKTKGKYLWLRNNISTITSQFIDSGLFVVLAFWGLYDKHGLFTIFITTFLIKTLVAIFDTPFVYWGKFLLQTRQQKTEHPFLATNS